MCVRACVRARVCVRVYMRACACILLTFIRRRHIVHSDSLGWWEGGGGGAEQHARSYRLNSPLVGHTLLPRLRLNQTQ